jgi:hypothetical protein
MNLKLKDVILKDLEKRVKLYYGDNFNFNVVDITNLFFKLYGKRTEELVAAIIEYFFKKYPKYLPTDLDFLFQKLLNHVEESSGDLNILVKYFTNNIFTHENINYDNIFRLFLKTANKELFHIMVENFYPLRSILRYMLSKAHKRTMSLDFVVEETIRMINNLNYDGIKDLSELFSLNELEWDDFQKLPKPLLSALYNRISKLSFSEQSNLKNTYLLPIQLFDKLDKTEKTYDVVGSPQGDKKLMTIKDIKDKTYGYVNGDGKIIIPPKFNDISAVRKGIIYAYITNDKGEIKAGYYKFDDEGNVLGYSKTDPNNMFS